MLFEPQTSVKAQILADFVVEFSRLEKEPSIRSEQWEVYMDGASIAEGARIGIIIKGQGKLLFQYAVKLVFPVTNNAAEYEALIKVMDLIKEISQDQVVIRCNSRRVTGQLNKSFQIKDESMGMYLSRERSFLSELESKGVICQIENISRDQNEKADRLAKAAAHPMIGNC